MPLMFGLPVHPAATHFPIAAAHFAAAALVVAAWLTARRRAEASVPWRIAGLLLLGVALLGVPVLIWSGRAWAISLDDMVAGSLLPRPDAEEGVLYKHALSAGATAAAVLAAFALAWIGRDPKKPILPAALAALLAASLIGFTGHLGGTMVHKPAGAPAEIRSK
jgi:heme A synthase